MRELTHKQNKILFIISFVVAAIAANMSSGCAVQEDPMPKIRPVVPGGSVAGQGRRANMGALNALQGEAFVAPSVEGRSIPSTLPVHDFAFGSEIGILTSTPTITANIMNISRVKGVDVDFDLAYLVGWVGQPAAGTETVGVGLYEITDGETAYFKLTLICQQFFTKENGVGSDIVQLTPAFSIRISRLKQYAVGVVWSTASIVQARALEFVGLLPPCLKTVRDVTRTTGMPKALEVASIDIATNTVLMAVDLFPNVKGRGGLDFI